MRFQQLAIADVVLITPDVIGDSRGFFFESWHQQRFAEAGIDVIFVQDNHSRSVLHTIRGLHYQLRRPQGKLVRVVLGEVFDVAVDVRRSSPTFGRWVGEVLSAENHRELWIPAGFAHGFVVLSESADLLYKVTDFYDPHDQVSIRWDDAALHIDWHLSPGIRPRLSAKDADGLAFERAECFP
jgi:dTDP-4-dehydrorhamnose 3,5-epimerase